MPLPIPELRSTTQSTEGFRRYCATGMNGVGSAIDTATDDTITVTLIVTDSPTLTTPPQRPTPSTGRGVGLGVQSDGHRTSVIGSVFHARS